MKTFALDQLRTVAEIYAPPPSLDETLAASLNHAQAVCEPFRHLRLEHLLPAPVSAALEALPLASPQTPAWGEPWGPAGVRRRLRSDGPAAAPVSRVLARAFAADTVAALIARRAGISVAGCRLALSVTQEIDGYACEPRTCEGEARFRFVVGLSPVHQCDLGPDLYRDRESWAAQLPWRSGSAFAFAPAADTWHGFEPRMIRRVRACLVVDYLAG